MVALLEKLVEWFYGIFFGVDRVVAPENGVRLVFVDGLFPSWAAAQTIGRTVFVKSYFLHFRGYQDELVWLLSHELVHVKQWKKYGFLFAILYPMASLLALVRGKHYYRDNRFEREAEEEKFLHIKEASSMVSHIV